MNTFMQRLTTNWHLMRIVRAGLGIMLLATGIQNKDWATGLFSIFFLYQAAWDTGCCGSTGCNTPPNRRSTGTTKRDVKIEEVEYEVIK